MAKRSSKTEGGTGSLSYQETLLMVLHSFAGTASASLAEQPGLDKKCLYLLKVEVVTDIGDLLDSLFEAFDYLDVAALAELAL